jgi:hypothetical protein
LQKVAKVQQACEKLQRQWHEVAKKIEEPTKKTKTAQKKPKKPKKPKRHKAAQKKPQRHKKNQNGTKRHKKNHFGPNRHKPAQSSPNLAQLYKLRIAAQIPVSVTRSAACNSHAKPLRDRANAVQEPKTPTA